MKWNVELHETRSVRRCHACSHYCFDLEMGGEREPVSR